MLCIDFKCEMTFFKMNDFEFLMPVQGSKKTACKRISMITGTAKRLAPMRVFLF